ncbi:hypothetical protein PTTG_11700 [Puccinia triticina 1-1 BBBD Race 1]|uniref:Uncharacterized protein n=1 Tax=Puccinia triticina (isolate 1-1 / race 1 (BBBD)) TaxID=630390 RepID=A0A180H4D5_PUCT1|nr:hypothetical protein PTTG_11700 [Puccinia triticina 1-1 BBBD Race 1]
MSLELGLNFPKLSTAVPTCQGTVKRKTATKPQQTATMEHDQPLEHFGLDPNLIKVTYRQQLDQSLLHHMELAHLTQGHKLREHDHSQEEQQQPVINEHHFIPEPQASRQQQASQQPQQQLILEPTISSEPLADKKEQLRTAVDKILNIETQFEAIQRSQLKIPSERANIEDEQALQPHEIVLPTNQFLFPESEQSLVFHPNQLQYIDRIRQENRNSSNHPHLVVSVGKIPPPPGTQAGRPFDDGFTCIVPPSPPPRLSIHPGTSNSAGSRPLDPSLLQSSSNLQRRRVGRPRKSEVNRNDPRSYTQSRPSDLVEDKKPVVEFAIHQDTENMRIPSGSSRLLTRATSSSEPADPESSMTRVIPVTTEPSPMSRKKEPWLSKLKITYAASLSKHSLSDLLVPYPKVGDTFKTVENFKEACLLASWPAGHDMHVRNHYKTDLWERCVFTCRHDRSPPKGLNCPFKIVAMGDKTNENSWQSIEVWKVIKSHQVHRNHPVGPGMYDPLGKRSYRKRTIGDDLSQTHSQPATSNTSMPPKKRGRPPRVRPPVQTVQTVQTERGPRPKPPPSVSFPAPTAITEWSRLAPSSASSASFTSDVYRPHASSNDSA